MASLLNQGRSVATYLLRGPKGIWFPPPGGLSFLLDDPGSPVRIPGRSSRSGIARRATKRNGHRSSLSRDTQLTCGQRQGALEDHERSHSRVGGGCDFLPLLREGSSGESRTGCTRKPFSVGTALSGFAQNQRRGWPRDHPYKNRDELL